MVSSIRCAFPRELTDENNSVRISEGGKQFGAHFRGGQTIRCAFPRELRDEINSVRISGGGETIRCAFPRELRDEINSVPG